MEEEGAQGGVIEVNVPPPLKKNNNGKRVGVFPEERKKGKEEIRVGGISFVRPRGAAFFLFLLVFAAAAAARESPCRRRTAAAVQ